VPEITAKVAEAREAAHQAVKAFDRNPHAGTTKEAIAALKAFLGALDPMETFLEGYEPGDHD
jgi:hypothetical protein